MPLFRQVYLRIRELILDGTLPRGARLPSTRALATELALSRNTVLGAVEQLVAEGYLVSRVGDGTYVAADIPEDWESPRRPRRRGPSAQPETPRLSERGERIRSTPIGRDSTEVRPFTVGMPAIDEFPWAIWNRLWTRRSRDLDRAYLCYGDPAGYRPLREAIAAYLNAGRGVRCEADQVIVVSSSQQALDIAARVLIDPGDAAWLEDPGYLGARGALAAAGARIVPVPVDEHGLRVADGRRRAGDARLVSVTPSHQYPAGVTMSLARRLELLDWAADRGAWVLEDDYDSEFRFVGPPLAALQGLDRAGRVIYIGTFTKVIYPSLRLAYVVTPPGLLDALVAARAFVDRHSPTLPQVVLSDFMAGGHFASHVRRMRSVYRDRRQCLLDALKQRLGDALEIKSHPAGMHLVVELADDCDDCAVAQQAAERGIEVSPLSRYYLGEARRGLLLGYSAVSQDAILAGVDALAEVLEAKEVS
ncbi:MAG: PLP-dependent aminotransferase family protein [Acidobacteriota bacterium]